MAVRCHECGAKATHQLEFPGYEPRPICTSCRHRWAGIKKRVIKNPMRFILEEKVPASYVEAVKGAVIRKLNAQGRAKRLREVG